MRLILGAITIALAVGSGTIAAQDNWTGVISDSMCGLKHANGDRACTEACMKKGASHVFVSGDKVYKLVDAKKLVAGHEGHKVQLTGELKGDTITVTKLGMAKSGFRWH
jgi:hypothetical protein